ncbi:MAG: ABC transporter substrate-binding protein [Anaerolineales bacterium]|nr:ABC transporter substrate-binding protein [Anaerolineales bacterium]
MELEALTEIPDLPTPPKRVVSLVPSITESLFVLGFGETVVGITDYCIYPQGQLNHLLRLGGTKNPDVEKVVALQPDLVFMDKDENMRATAEELLEAGVRIWVSFPHTVDAGLDLLRDLLAIYHTDRAAMQVATLQAALDWAKRAAESQEPKRFFCPIWADETDGVQWWMTANEDTYLSDLLTTLGGINIFAERQRSYPLSADMGLTEAEDPGERDTRFPRVILEEILAAEPEIIFLPSEPFAFDLAHKRAYMQSMSTTPAAKHNRMYLVDGSLLAWPGARLAKALNELPRFFE